jgi:RimJ/RimL family protein N-acetyltransferase
MIAPLRPGVTPAQANSPIIETERLRLRQWQGSDMVPYTAMLSDPGTARFITVDGKPVIDGMTGWRHTVVMAGHWVIHGAGMFVVEEKSSGQFAGRVGPWRPPGWPGFEVGWGIAKEFRGKGYAVEAARASINWSFATYDIDRIVHCIDCKAWRASSGPKPKARSNCSVMSPTSGSPTARPGKVSTKQASALN